MPSVISVPPTPLACPQPHTGKKIDDNVRLASRHQAIKHAVLDGNLIHPSIALPAAQVAIADIACGPGSWLRDVQSTLFSIPAACPPVLVGFDTELHTRTSLAQGIDFVQHDCAIAFSPEYIGKFDLVNICTLACTLPKEQFQNLVSNAISLLRPGGYLQWLEAESRLFKQYPPTSGFTEAVYTINVERRAQGLVTDMPHFMVQEMLRHDVESASRYPMSILEFKLISGGICRNESQRDDGLDAQLSYTVLSSIQNMLAAPLQKSLSQTEKTYIHSLIDAVSSDMENGQVIAGGMFPLLIAQKASE